MLSSFFWGYIVFQIPGALAAHKYGGKTVFGLGVLSTAILTIILPLCTHSVALLYLVRGLTGVGEAVTFPALNMMATLWFPAPERSFLVAAVTAGSYFGTALAFPAAGYLMDLHKAPQDVWSRAHNLCHGGISTTWPWVFYSFGGVGVLWWVFWNWLIADSPDVHQDISDVERQYLMATSKDDADTQVEKVSIEKSDSPPWVGFFTTPCVWALFVIHFAANWNLYTLLNYLPKYLTEEQGFNIASSGFLSSLPYVLLWLCSVFAGWWADHLIQHHISVRATRILMTAIAFIGSGVSMSLTGFMPTPDLAVVSIMFSIVIAGFNAASVGPNYVELCPHWAGALFSVGNTLGNFAGLFAPLVEGRILGIKEENKQSRKEDWQWVFYISAAILMVSLVIYALGAQGKPQRSLN